MTAEILLTGGSGQIGTALRALEWPGGLRLVAPSRSELKLAEPAALSLWLAGRQFQGIINCGAFTGVDEAETEVAQAWLANAVAPAILGAHAASRQVPIIHVSTDYVFDGSKSAPYLEDDPVRPLNVYGAAKEGGEQAIRTSRARHVILRTSWVVSPHGSNFVKTMLRLASERPTLRVVNDQHGTPTAAQDIAIAIRSILLRQRADASAPSGTYHFAGSGSTTWFGLAGHALNEAARHGHPLPALEAIPTSAYPLPARRPANSCLDCGKIARDYGIMPRPWPAAVSEIVDTLLTPVSI